MSGWALVASTLAVLAAVAVLNGLWRRARRARWVAEIPRHRVRRRAVAVPVAIHAPPGALPNVFGGRINRDTADLVLTDDRLLLVANRGLLLDLVRGQDRGPRRLTGIRCPAPQLLVLLGEHVASGAEFRIEIALVGAGDWSEALRGFAPATPYAVRPPDVS